MKLKKTAVLLTAFVLCASVLASCGKPVSKPVQADPAQSSSAVVSANASSQPSSAPAESEVSEVVPGGNEPAESQPGPVLEIQTDDKAFNEKFADNPIDKAYIKEINNAISNVDMVNVSDKYSEIWQKEITHAYTELKKYMATDSSMKPKTLQKEQEDWENGKAAAMKKISEEAQAAGGSMVEVNVASKAMDYYRSRAAQLYKELYGYKQDFTFAYTGK
jgi:uncharacterized protein YecT (DUF1311 family)